MASGDHRHLRTALVTVRSAGKVWSRQLFGVWRAELALTGGIRCLGSLQSTGEDDASQASEGSKSGANHTAGEDGGGAFVSYMLGSGDGKKPLVAGFPPLVMECFEWCGLDTRLLAFHIDPRVVREVELRISVAAIAQSGQASDHDDQSADEQQALRLRPLLPGRRTFGDVLRRGWQRLDLTHPRSLDGEAARAGQHLSGLAYINRKLVATFAREKVLRHGRIYWVLVD